MIKVKVSGDYHKTESFLKKIKRMRIEKILDEIGEEGVAALYDNTPKDTGLTANSWYYVIERTPKGYKISWRNSNIQSGIPIALILQLGHTTPRGTWVEGRDYINPSLKPIFDGLSEKFIKEVSKL